VDESPPHLLAVGLGAQVVVLILAGIVLAPMVVLRAAGAEARSVAWAVFAALLVSGLTTMVQARPLGRFGAGYILFMGTSGAFIAAAISAVADGGLPLLMTLVAVSSLFQFYFAGRLSALRRIVTPAVGGTVIMLIAVSVFPIAFDLLGKLPDPARNHPLAAPVSAAMTFAVMIGLALFGGRAVRLWAPIIGVLAGCVTAGWFGIMDLSQVMTLPWIGLPQGSWPGFDLSFDARFWALLPAFVIVTIIGAIETYGDGIAIQRVSHRGDRAVDFRSVQGAVYADGLGNLLAGIAGTLPNTTYSTSISVVDITGVASSRVALYGGAILALLAFSPKLAGLVLAVPDPVAGAYIILLLILLFGHGIRLVAEDGLSDENLLVAGTAFWLGSGFQNQQIFQELLPAWAKTLLNNGMTAGGLVAVGLMGVLAAVRGRSRDRISVALDVQSVRAAHEFIDRFAVRLGWDRSAVRRLQLVTEEAILYLISRQGAEDLVPGKTISLTARYLDDVVELEIVAGPQRANMEDLLRLLRTDGVPVEDDLSLRLLRSLALDVVHQQYHGLDCLIIRVDSRPLGEEQ
jgi:NCS2 family nucleobase:cation symporter-2/xanthine permease XanP